MISSSTLEAMAAAGCSIEQIIAVVKAEEAKDAERALKRREDAKNRQRKHRSNAVSRDVTHVTRDTPSPPSFPLFSPPTTPPIIPQSSTPTPAAGAALPLADFDSLAEKLETAVGTGNIQPMLLLNLSPIVGLIQSGVDLETDILPVLRSRAKTMKAPARSWTYFTDAITEAHNSRVSAGKGIVKTTQTTFDESPERWEKRMIYARENEVWNSEAWGPSPGTPGCKVPDSLLTENDGLGWRMTG